VNRSSEVIEMAERRPTVAEQTSDRAQAFMRLADQHLDAAYRLARAILRDATDALLVGSRTRVTRMRVRRRQ
jgi:hypothetical protein